MFGDCVKSGLAYIKQTQHQSEENMRGSAELAQLAHLLRVSAKTALDIAWMRGDHAAEITEVAHEIEKAADVIEGIVSADKQPNEIEPSGRAT